MTRCMAVCMIKSVSAATQSSFHKQVINSDGQNLAPGFWSWAPGFHCISLLKRAFKNPHIDWQSFVKVAYIFLT